MKRRKIRRMQQHADALHAIHEQIDQRFAQAEDKRVRKQARFVRRAVNSAFQVGAEHAIYEQEAAITRQYEHAQQQNQPYPYLTPEAEERIYQRGFHDANLQHVAERARWQQERAALERQKAIGGEFSREQMDTARQASYNQGYTKGHNTGYRLGVQAGQAQARVQKPQQPATKVTDELRQMMIDKVMDECRVIGESNPQMEAGMKAVRHRIKKINFG